METFERKRKHSLVSNKKYEVNVRGSDNIPQENINSPSKKLKMEKQKLNEITCESKIDKTFGDYLTCNYHKQKKNLPSTCKKKKFDSYAQQFISSRENYDHFQSSEQYGKSSKVSNETAESYENFDQNIENVLHNSSNTEENKTPKTAEYTKHKKKKECVTDILKSNELNEEMPSITLSELVQKSENSKNVKGILSSKICDTMEKNTDSPIVKKKPKCKRHLSLENISEIAETNFDVLGDVMLKHKKRKKEHSVDKNSSILTEMEKVVAGNQIDCVVSKVVKQCEKNLKVLHKASESYENFGQNFENVLHNSSNTEKSKTPKTPKFTKHKRKKKEKECIIDVFQSNDLNQENPSIMLSKSLQKYENLKNVKSISSSKICDIMDKNTNGPIIEKKFKHKRHISLENESEITETNWEMPGDIMLKHKKKRKEHLIDEKISCSETEKAVPGNHMDSIVSKHAKKINDVMLLSNVQSQNKYQKEGNNLLEISVKKRNKIHKKHSKNSDLTSNDYKNLLIDPSESQNISVNYSSIKVGENSNLQNKGNEFQISMKNEQYLADNSSKYKKIKKHKDSFKSVSPQETIFIDSSPDDSINYTSTAHLNKLTKGKILNHEEILINSPDQNTCQVYKSKKKKNKYENKNDISLNLHMNINTPHADLVQDTSGKLLQNDDVVLTFNSAIHKRSKKHSKHNSSKIGLTETDKNISIVKNDISTSSHSEVISKSCHKILKSCMGVTRKLDYFLSQSEKELEDILFSDCEIEGKRPREHKKHHLSHAGDKKK